MIDRNGHEIGVQRVTSALHFGPSWNNDAFKKTKFSKNNATNYANSFHKYAFTWDDNGIRFFIDDIEIGNVPVNDGFWKRGNFNGNNIWSAGNKMAPFDQEVNTCISNIEYQHLFFFNLFSCVKLHKIQLRVYFFVSCLKFLTVLSYY